MAIDPTEARWFRKQNAAARAMLRVYESARRELYGALLETGPEDQGLTAMHRRAMLQQVDVVIAKLQQEAGILLFKRVSDGLADGAKSAAKEVGMLARDPELVISLSRLNPALVEYHVMRGGELIQGLTAEIKSSIRLELASAQAQGLHARQAAKRVAGLLGQDAKLPKDKTERRAVMKRYQARAETIARTEFSNAANEAFGDTLKQAEALGLPVGKRWSATLDSRTSGRCRSLHAKYNTHPIPLDQPFVAGDGWQGMGAPAHPNCLPGDSLVTAVGVSAATKRWYDGNLVVISTASGKKLSCTPNHPILTPAGWVAAGLLNEGGHVISSRLSEWMPAAINGDNENVPTSIDEVAEAFGRSEHVLAHPVPTAPEHFHGDGGGSEVAVVWTDCLLRDGVNPTLVEKPKQLNLGWAGVAALVLPRDGSCGKFIASPLGSPDSVVSGCHLSGLGSGIHLRPLDGLRFTPASQLNTGLLQSVVDDTRSNAIGDGQWSNAFTVKVSPDHFIKRYRDTAPQVGANDTAMLDASIVQAPPHSVSADGEVLGYLGNGLAGGVSTDNLVDRQINFGAPDGLSGITQDIGDLGPVDAELARQLTDGLAGPVIADEVIDVQLVPFSGHVFNLQTAGGYYIAEGILTHNCRSRVATGWLKEK